MNITAEDVKNSSVARGVKDKIKAAKGFEITDDMTADQKKAIKQKRKDAL